jgi:hypothetical protein
MADRYRPGQQRRTPLPYRRPDDAAPISADAASLIAALAQQGIRRQQQRVARNTPPPQQTPPVPMGSGGAPMTPSPQYVSRPDLRIRGVEGNPNLQTRQYDAPRPPTPQPVSPGLPPPTDSNGVPYPGWDQLSRPEQENIYDNLGLPIPETAVVPATFERNASATYGNNNQTIMPPVDLTGAGRPDVPGSNTVGQRSMTVPPPGVPMETGEWESYGTETRQAFWDDYFENKRRNATDTIPYLPESEQGEGYSIGNSWAARKAKLAAEEAYNSPPGELAQDVVKTGIDIISAPFEEVRLEAGDAAYYMATHDGEKPSDLNDLSTYVAWWMSSGQELPANWQLIPPDPMKDDPGWLAMSDEAKKNAWMTYMAGSDNAFAQLSLMAYLEEHPESYATVKQIYEQAEMSGQDGGDAVYSWYEQEIGPWWSLANSAIFDPLNLAAGVGLASRGLTGLAGARVARSGGEVSNVDRALATAGTLLDPYKLLDQAAESGIEAVRAGWNKIPIVSRATQDAAETVRQSQIDDIQKARRTVANQVDADEMAQTEGQQFADEVAAEAENVVTSAQMRAQQDAIRKQRRTRGNTPQNQPITPEPVGLANDLQRQAEFDTIMRDRRARTNTPTAQEPRLTVNTPADELFDGVAPLPAEADAALSRYDDMMRNDPASFEAQVPEVDVPLSSRMVESTGDGLYPERIQEYVDNPNQPSIGAEGPVEQSIIAVRVGDTLYVVEGKHRIAAAKIRGDASITMRVIDATPAGVADEAASVADDIPTSTAPGMTETRDMVGRRAWQTDDGFTVREQVRAGSRDYVVMRQGEQGVIATGESLDEALAAARGTAPTPSGRIAAPESVGPVSQNSILNQPMPQQFWDEIAGRESFARARQGDESAQGFIDRVEHRVYLEDATLRHGGDLNDYVKSNHGKDSIQGAIQRLVFGTEAEADAARTVLRRNVTANSPHITQSDVDRLEELRNIRLGNAPYTEAGVRPAPVRQPSSRATPSSRANPRPEAGTSTSDALWSRVDPKRQDQLSWLRDEAAKFANETDIPDDILDRIFRLAGDQSEMDIGRALFGPRGNASVAGSAAESRMAIHNYDKALGNWLKAERARLFGDTVPPRIPKGIGIINDPAAAARGPAQATRSRIRKTGDFFLDRIVKASDEVSAVEEKTEADRWFNTARIDADDRRILNDRRTLEIDGDERQVSFIDRFTENLNDIRAKKVRELKVPKRTARSRPLSQADADRFAEQLKSSYADSIDEALAKTEAEFVSVLEKKGKRTKAGRAHSAAMNAIRQNIMYNPATGISATAKDIVGSAYIAATHGELARAQDMGQIGLALLKSVPDDVRLVDRVPALHAIRNTGKDVPQEYLSRAAMARTQADTTNLWTTALLKSDNAGKKAIGAVGQVVAAEPVYALRNASESMIRVAAFNKNYQKGLEAARANFMLFLRGKADKLGRPGIVEDMRAFIDEMGGEFTPEQVRDLARDRWGLTDDSIARTWAGELNTTWRNAKKKTDRLYFDYKKKKFDVPLSQAFMFHYFMTRAVPQQFRFLMTHPNFARAYSQAWESHEDLGESVPGFMRDYVQFMKQNHMAFLADPWAIVMPWMTFATLGKGAAYNATELERLMETTGLYFNPVNRGILAAMGIARPSNVFGTNAPERLITSVIDYMRNHDMMPGMGPGITPHLVEESVRKVVNFTSEVVDDISSGLGVDTFFHSLDMDSLQDQEQDQVRKLVVDDFTEEHGPEESWTLDEAQELDDALTAVDENKPNYWADRARKRYSMTEVVGDLARVASPVNVGVVDEELNELRAGESGYYDALDAGEQPTEEQEYGQFVGSRSNAGDPRVRDLRSQNEVYSNLGTEDEQWVLENYQRIAFYDLPPNKKMKIGGTWYSSTQVNRMSSDERFALADQWLRDIEQDGSVPGATDIYQSIKDKQGQIRAGSADFDDFKTYQGWVRDGGSQAIDILRSADGSEVARLIDEKVEGWKAEGLSEEEIDERLTQWVSSEDGYAATMGWRTTNDDPGSAVYNEGQVPLWRQKDEAGSSGGSKTAKEDEEPLSLAETLGPDRKRGHQFNNEYVAKAWSDDLAAQRMSPNEIERNLRYGLIKPETLRAMAQSGQITRQDIVNWVSDGTLLKFDLYGMAEVEGVPAGDIRFLVEDGYLSMDAVLDLIFNPSEQDVMELRRLNQDRKYNRENQPDTGSQSGYGNFLSEYLFKK